MIRHLILCSLLFVFHPIYGNNSQKITHDKHFVFGFDLGVSKTNQLGRAVSFPLGYSTFNYLPDTNASSSRYGISLGRSFELDPLDTIIIGLSYHQLGDMNVNGILQQGIFPPFYSANYQYTTQLSQLLLEAKVQHEWHGAFYPYLTAGIGKGFNKAKQFETTVPYYLTVTPLYTNHTSASISYALGFGVDTLLTSNVTLGIGYLFSDIGRVGLGNGIIRETDVPNYLSQSHLNINTLLAQLNWYF